MKLKGNKIIWKLPLAHGLIPPVPIPIKTNPISAKGLRSFRLNWMRPYKSLNTFLNYYILGRWRGVTADKASVQFPIAYKIEM